MKGKKQENIFTDVTNVTQGSVSLPEHGILRAGKTASVRSELLDTRDYRDFIARGIIAVGGVETLKKKEEESKKAKANLLGRNGKPKKEAKGKIKRVGVTGSDSDDNNLFENGVEPGEEDGIIFVDIEQNQERIRNHPVLSKLRNKDND